MARLWRVGVDRVETKVLGRNTTDATDRNADMARRVLSGSQVEEGEIVEIGFHLNPSLLSKGNVPPVRTPSSQNYPTYPRPINPETSLRRSLVDFIKKLDHFSTLTTPLIPTRRAYEYIDTLQSWLLPQAQLRVRSILKLFRLKKLSTKGRGTSRLETLTKLRNTTRRVSTSKRLPSVSRNPRELSGSYENSR